MPAKDFKKIPIYRVDEKKDISRDNPLVKDQNFLWWIKTKKNPPSIPGVRRFADLYGARRIL